jgi:hypothetical protein
MAHCCKATYDREYKLEVNESVMKKWINDPTCPIPSSVFSRRALLVDDIVGNASLSTELVTRDTTKV